MTQVDELILYSAPWCSYCVALQAKLDSRGIAYEYRNVDEDGIRREMNENTDGNQTIPVLLRDNRYWINPDETALKEALNG